MKLWMILAAGLVLSGCAEGRRVGTVFDPVCAEDGSVVFYQIANSQGSYEGLKASKENCRWSQ